MRFFVMITAVCLLVPRPTVAATLDHHPNWESTKLPDLYYEVLARSVELESGLQAPDGRFRGRLPAPGDDESSWRVTVMQYIYVPALLYVSVHPSNPLRGDRETLEMALRAGDYLAGCITPEGAVQPTVNGVPTNPLDAHRTLYCWAEVYGLLQEHLDSERLARWNEALTRAGEALVQDISPRMDRPRYTSPFLGYSPNYFGLRATTIWRMGMVLGREDWVGFIEPAVRRFVREITPGGYWEEHDGPTMSYDYLNTSVAGLCWHYIADPAAWSAMQRNTRFHVHWTTPDGVDIHTVDQRNRNHFSVRASWGLFSFCHFPQGRRYARFKLLAALGDGSDPIAAMGLNALARVAQSAHYHMDGDEWPIPQEYRQYRHTLDRPAVVRKKGPWVYSMSALVSPERPLSQFYLDRTGPVSLWHAAAGHIIAGGNSKGQPRLATFAVLREDGSWSYLPLDGLISGSWDADTMSIAHEGYSLRLTIEPVDSTRARIRACAESTYDRGGEEVRLHLPLIMEPGQEVLSSNLGPQELSAGRTVMKNPGSISFGRWTLALPGEAVFEWPYYTYTPYGPVRVPENLHNAVGLVSIPLVPDGAWTTAEFIVE